jgi:hypothetical protein
VSRQYDNLPDRFIKLLEAYEELIREIYLRYIKEGADGIYGYDKPLL